LLHHPSITGTCKGIICRATGITYSFQLCRRMGCFHLSLLRTTTQSDNLQVVFPSLVIACIIPTNTNINNQRSSTSYCDTKCIIWTREAGSKIRIATVAYGLETWLVFSLDITRNYVLSS
jgi:hypothetical protein